MMAHATDGQSGSGSAGPTDSLPIYAKEIERRRQIESLLEQGDRDITDLNGCDWVEVKQRMRDRVAAWTR